MLWFGRGIAAGAHQGPADIADIAPTLSALLGLASPAGAKGRALAGLVR